MSYRGRILVVNNLVSSALWHKLMCADPPASLLSTIQRLLVDFFWDKLHWVPQGILFLPKEEGGQGLVHLASRWAAFRLQFLQRLLKGPEVLVWRPLAISILQRAGELGLSLFLTDGSRPMSPSLPPFYRSLLSVWSVLKKQRQANTVSLCWLLKEPLLHGSLTCPDWAGPALCGRFSTVGIHTLGHLLERAGPQLNNSVELAGHLGLKSSRTVDRLLAHWNQQLTGKARILLTEFSAGTLVPDSTDPFPDIYLSPDLGHSPGPTIFSPVSVSLEGTGKMFYKLMVQALNHKK